MIGDLDGLERYEGRWEELFGRKRKMIEKVRKMHRRKVKGEREMKEEERMREVY